MIDIFNLGFDVMTLAVFLWTLFQEWRIRKLRKEVFNDNNLNKVDELVTKIKDDINDGRTETTTNTSAGTA